MDSPTTAWIAGYARTPFYRFNGLFSEIPSTALVTHASAAALADAGVSPEEVDIAVVGQALQGVAEQNPAQQTAVAAGIPYSVPSITVNAVCLSGAETVTPGHPAHPWWRKQTSFSRWGRSPCPSPHMRPASGREPHTAPTG